MKSDKELESFTKFVEDSYNSSASCMLSLHLDKYTGSKLGYCFKSELEDGRVNYNVFCSETEDSSFNLRIKAHEYGHIYLAHLDGLRDDLDKRAISTIDTMRDELVDLINKECDITWGDKLLSSVIKEGRILPYIHNVAMDMEVNSSILSLDDIESMEVYLTSLMKKDTSSIINSSSDTDKEMLDNKDVLVKLIHPNRYHIYSVDNNGDRAEFSFPAGLTYEEYLIMIIKHLDQFIKMAVSISLGKNGDTSDVTSQELQDYFKKLGEAAENLDELTKNLSGNSSDSGEGDSKDHKSTTNSSSGNKEAKNSDNKGNKSKSKSAGDSRGTSDFGEKRSVSKAVDPVSMALNEVINDLRNRTIKWSSKRDMMRNYNRGAIRSVIAPTIVRTYSISKELSVAFLIDISGSMEASLIDRCIKTIAEKMKKINGGLKYDIITCNTSVQDVFTKIDPRKSIPHIYSGGGTRIAAGIEYFRKNYSKETTLVIISDFEDDLKEWNRIESQMNGYRIYGFNYGNPTEKYYNNSIHWKNLKERNF